MYIATIGLDNESGHEVVAIDTNEAASLATMTAFAELGYSRLHRFTTTVEVYFAYSEGKELATDIDEAAAELGEYQPILRPV